MTAPEQAGLIAGIAALLIQGGVSIRRASRATTVGLLNLVIAAIVLVLWLSQATAAIVFSPAFSALMVTDVWNTVTLAVTLGCVCLCGGMLWLAARVRQAGAAAVTSTERTVILMASAGAAILTAVESHVLPNGGPFAVHCFDLWWPPFAMWMVLCLSQAIAALFGFHKWVERVFSFCALAAPASLFALGWTELADPFTAAPFTQGCWEVVLYLSYCGVFAGLCSWVVSALLAYWNVNTAGWKMWQRAAIALAGAVLAGLLIVFLPEPSGAVPNYRDNRGPALLALAIVYAIGLLRALLDPAFRQTLLAHWRVLLLLVSSLLLFDLLFTAFLDGIFDLILTGVCYVMVAEYLASGTYKTFQDWVKAIGSLLKGPVDKAGAWIRSLVAKETDGGGKSVIGKGLIAAAWLLAILFLCVVVNERGHAGKTIIEPFGNPDKDDQKLDPGRHLSELLANSIAEIRDEIPEVIPVSERSSGGGHSQSRQLELSGGEDLASAVAGANEFDLFGVKIPLGSVLSVMQRPVRAAFNVEAIGGSLFKQDSADGGTRWTAVASTEHGQSWRVSVDLPKGQETPDTQKSQGNAAKGAGAQANEKGAAAKDGKKPSSVVSQPPEDDSQYDCGQTVDESKQSPLERLALRLAFRIERADAGSGVSSSFRAFQDFDRGVKGWNRYRAKLQPGTALLKNVIACFQSALAADASFAAAYYRLGEALQEKQEYVAAAGAFAKAAAVAPQSNRGNLRRAYSLYSLKSDAFSAMAPDIPTPSTPITQGEAKSLWQRVAMSSRSSESEKRDAYAGLCWLSLDEEAQYRYKLDQEEWNNAAKNGNAAGDFTGRRQQVADVTGRVLARFAAPEHRYNSYLPFFYCTRALAFARSASSGRTDDRRLEANLLNTLGVAVDFRNQRKTLLWFEPVEKKDGVRTKPLLCDDSAIDISALRSPDRLPVLGWSNPVSWRAIPYYREAVNLSPGDAANVCNLASASYYSGGDPTLLREGSQDVFQLIRFAAVLKGDAHDFAWLARRDPEDASDDRSHELAKIEYQLAMMSLETAIASNGASADALNDFADSVYRWSFDANYNDFDGPDLDSVLEAEQDARAASRYAPHAESGDHVALSTTLGEILIVESRFKDAIAKLKPLQGDAEAGPVLGTEWEIAFARANGCAAEQATGAQKQNFAQTFAKSVERLRGAQKEAEFRFYFDVPWSLADQQLKTCMPRKPLASKPLPSVAYGEPRVVQPGPGCSPVEVMAVVSGDTDDRYLHVWMDGREARAKVNEGTIPLLAEDSVTELPEVFYANIVKGGGDTPTPLSPLARIKFTAPAPGEGCADRTPRLMKLSFAAPPAKENTK